MFYGGRQRVKKKVVLISLINTAKIVLKKTNIIKSQKMNNIFVLIKKIHL